MGIQGSIAIRMINIDSAAESPGLYFDSCHESLCCRTHRHIFPGIRLEVKSHMIMVGPELAEISTEPDRNIKRVAKISFGICFHFRLRGRRNSNKKEIQDYS